MTKHLAKKKTFMYTRGWGGEGVERLSRKENGLMDMDNKAVTAEGREV